MAKQKKHLLEFDNEIDYNLLGICSHHNDYRLAWSLNSTLGFHLEQSLESFIISTTKKGVVTHQAHTMFEYYEDENRVNYYLIKNKCDGKLLIPEKPTIDFFLFIHKCNVINLDELQDKIRQNPSVLAVFQFDPETLPSTEHIIF